MVMCSCDYYGDGEPADVFKVVIVKKSAKDHICCECGGAIKKGSSYEKASGLWDGSWSTYKTCAICVRIRKDYCPRGFVFGSLRETLDECLGVEL